MKMKLKMSVMALALAGLSGLAQANTLAQNQTVSPLDILATAPAGTLLASIVEAVNAPTFSGTLRTAVYDGPEAGVNLDFYYQFTNSANSANAVGRVTGYNFDGFTTNVFQTAQAFGVFLAGQVTAD